MDGDAQLVKELLEKGVDVKDAEGQTAMAIADSYDDQRAKKVLAELGAK
ncbi:MAG: hypothetical protein LJF15_16335 [Acidobacteria bacterium]|nr:hypothetical protein [Acidobacteriota bacterium]